MTTRVRDRLDFAAANHTFSSREWRATVEHKTIEWINALAGGQ
jgi:hypothetical protein